jgi:hypothetical protein
MMVVEHEAFTFLYLVFSELLLDNDICRK